MTKTSALLRRLLPAAFTTALFAAMGHAVLVSIAARSAGLEFVYIGGLTIIVAFIVAVPIGAILLVSIGMLRLKPMVSLLLFIVVIQGVGIGLEILFFEFGWADISWQYGLITVPAAFIAWYFSVYAAWRNEKNK